MKPDLDWHKTDKTDELVKAENPDNDFMKSKKLCTKCHGPEGACDCFKIED